MSQRKMVSHNGVRMSDHGGMGAGGGMNYAGGSPGFYAPGSPKGGSVVQAPAGVPGLGGNPMQGQPGHSIPSKPDPRVNTKKPQTDPRVNIRQPQTDPRVNIRQPKPDPRVNIRQPGKGDGNPVGGRPKTAKPGMSYAGGTPGFYEPGGPGYGSPQPFPGNGGRPAPKPMPSRGGGGAPPTRGMGDGNTVGSPIYDPRVNIRQPGGKRRSVASRRFKDYQR